MSKLPKPPILLAFDGTSSYEKSIPVVLFEADVVAAGVEGFVKAAFGRTPIYFPTPVFVVAGSLGVGSLNHSPLFSFLRKFKYKLFMNK